MPTDPLHGSGRIYGYGAAFPRVNAELGSWQDDHSRDHCGSYGGERLPDASCFSGRNGIAGDRSAAYCAAGVYAHSFCKPLAPPGSLLPVLRDADGEWAGNPVQRGISPATGVDVVQAISDVDALDDAVWITEDVYPQGLIPLLARKNTLNCTQEYANLGNH